MNSRLVLTLAITSVLLAACSGGSNSSAGSSNPPPAGGNTGVVTARFDPAAGVVPFPTNLLRLGSTDGTLNIPVANPNNYGDPAVAMNALDGFSTTSPITTSMSASLNASTVVPGSSVRLFEVTTNAQGAVTGVVRALTAGTEYTATMSGTNLVILPLRALKPLTGYMAVLTNGLRDAAGNTVTPDTTYFLTQRTTPICNGAVSLDPQIGNSSCPTIETLRQLTNAQEAAAAAAGVNRSSIVLSWSFTTQSTSQVLQQMMANSAAGYVAPRPISAVNVSAAPFNLVPSLVNPALANNFNIHIGKITLPYFLKSNTQAAGWNNSAGNPVPGPLGGFWVGPAGSNVTVFNPRPVKQSDQTVPVLLNVPKTAKPASGWPVVIYQHGITRTRTDAFAVSNALASAGYAVIAIDIPLHGIAANSTLGGAGALATATGQASTERTFSVDYVNNTTSAPGPDGNVDASGTHMINLSSLLTSRDNIRQGILDLLNLRASIGGLDISGDSVGDFDASKIHFVGQSLGSIIGGSFVALDPAVSKAVLSVPGGGIARLLDGSQTFATPIRAGLAAAGVPYPSAAYDQFMLAAQTAVDSADPINLAPLAPATDAILLHMVNGDTVIPNAVAAGPLSGTRPLIRAYPLAKITASTAASTIRHYTAFTAGSHGSLLDPTSSAAATVEMQTQMVSFLLSGGTQVQVANPAVIETTP